MPWKQIGKNKYFYLSKREGGRVVSQYFGRKEGGELMAELIKLNREERDERRAKKKVEREMTEREERKIAAWYEQIETMAIGAMVASGYHRHKGQWRRRIMTEQVIATEAGEASTDTCPQAKMTWDEFRDLVQRAEDGDEKCILNLRHAMHSGNYPDWLRWLQDTRGNPAVWLRNSLAARLAGRGNPIRMQAAEATMIQLCSELEGPNATPMERLLAERAVFCWYEVTIYETLFNELKDMTIRQSEFHLRKIDAAHRRFLSAMSTLARVRKLALPHLQVNIGTNQVNVAHAEGLQR